MADSDTDNAPNPDDAEAQTPAETPTGETLPEETPSPDAEAPAPESADAEAPAPESAGAETPAPESETETSAPEPAAETEGAAAEEPAAETPSEAAAEAEGAVPADTGGGAAGAAGTAEAQLTPKERRRRARSKHTGAPRPPRTPQERHAERMAERREKAARRRARRSQERAKAAAARAKGGGRPGASNAEPLAPVHAPVEGKRRVRQGVVVSDKAEKTITVRIDVARPHSRYEKIVRSSSTLHAHDENNQAHEGDIVRVIESRPLSRTKHWTLVDVLERAR
jgi:small subunit ribosomal protein S17